MKIQIKINTGFVSEGGKGSVWESVNLSENDVNEFKLKRDSLEYGFREIYCTRYSRFGSI